jgi:hypothetical protein
MLRDPETNQYTCCFLQVISSEIRYTKHKLKSIIFYEEHKILETPNSKQVNLQFVNNLAVIYTVIIQDQRDFPFDSHNQTGKKFQQHLGSGRRLHVDRKTQH